MNKVLSALLVVALMFASVSVAKASNDTVVGITYYDDDSYVITTINYAVTKSSSTVSGSKMLMYGKEASNRKQEIDRQHYTIPNQRPKDKHCGKI